MKSHFEQEPVSFADAIDEMTDAQLDDALAAGKAAGLYQTFVEGKQVLSIPEPVAKESYLRFGMLA